MRDVQICWRGFVGGTTGYDNASREYLLALDRQGIDVKVEPMSYTNDIFVKGVDESQVARIKELIAKPYAENKDKVLVFHSQPNTLNPDNERLKYNKVINLTVWETTKVPENWIGPANKCDAVIVPSKQNVQALRDSGITTDIYMVPHGINANVFNPDNRKMVIDQATGKFTFLSVFQWQHRKAPEVLLQSYWKEFTSKDNVCLVLKTYYGSHVINKAEARSIVQQIIGYKQHLGVQDSAPIYITTSVFNVEDLKGLYTMANCFVLPTRGEGVGLPYLEALSSGIPVVGTAWGGAMDFLSNENAYLADYELQTTDSQLRGAISPNFNQLFTPDMKWAEPNIDSVRFQMRRAYENPDLAKRKGAAGREMVLNMPWDRSGELFKKVIEDVLTK